MKNVVHNDNVDRRYAMVVEWENFLPNTRNLLHYCDGIRSKSVEAFSSNENNRLNSMRVDRTEYDLEDHWRVFDEMSKEFSMVNDKLEQRILILTRERETRRIYHLVVVIDCIVNNFDEVHQRNRFENESNYFHVLLTNAMNYFDEHE